VIRYNDYKQQSAGDKVLVVFCYVFVIFYSILIILPFWTIVMDSFSSSLVKTGVRLLPDQFSLEAYSDVFSQKNLGYYYSNSIFRTVVGTILCVVTTYLASYPLSKSYLPFNRLITYMMLFTMYFGGGLIPTYLLYKNIGLIDNRWVLVLPGMFSAYYILVMRNFITDIPIELEESAKLDGANELVIAVRVYLPLMKPILATVALWAAVAQWNEWFNALIYIVTPTKQVMQVALRRMLIDTQLTSMFDDSITEIKISEDSVKAVTIIITILPILCIYPFAQRYFIQGLTSGAVKG
jgi:putative aldouronate transport system permease protein